jgi:hypothetical protein
MELENHTQFPGMLYRTTLPEKDGRARFAAAVIARVTYDRTDWGLVPAGEQVWPLVPEPWVGPQGPMDGDEVFYRGGVDVLVFGHARAPGGRPVTRVEVTLRVNDFQYQTVVFGDRVWERAGDELVPSPPKPFTAIPLTPDRAFGGKGEWDGLDVPYQWNPDGRGFYLEKESAVGRPLPNVELPDQSVRRWDDTPMPALWTPLAITSCVRMLNGLELDERGGLKKLKGEFFNAAPPGLIVPRLSPGDRIEIAGVTESGPLTVELPPNNLKARLQFGEKVIEQPLAIDQVGIEVDQHRVFVTFRYAFRYVLNPLEKRTCELLPR